MRFSIADSFLKKLASTLTRFMLRWTCLGWRTASVPKTSTEPASGMTSVETTRTSVLFPLPFGPRMPTTSPRPTASETESRARTTSPRRFLKLFSTSRSSSAFTKFSLKSQFPREGPALQPAPRFQPLPDESPGLLPLGCHRKLEEPARHPGAQGGGASGPRVPLALGHPSGEVLPAQVPVLYHVVPTSVHLRSPSLLLSSRTPGVVPGSGRMGTVAFQAND